ncbi:cellobiose-binding protein [Murinocardiopsis flavida]|uniref:Cellobiose-binding protein n=1 Tax=Murinocardiopsis flavida TaxID=645275 RepID=A0A2P8DGV1_9ACTN|nr:ABC transporter substrate-binding protein [Murinocardiopsis flavida]PSK96443.1 cellobiose-binding protein [Murinocardiopsis flavida]
MATRRRVGYRIAAIASGGVLLASTACGGGGGGDADGKVTLTIETFGTFGYEELFKQYEEDNPNVTIKERNVVQLDDYAPKLQQNIAAGSGTGDVVAIEEGLMVSFVAQPDKFVDLNEYGGAKLEDNFLDWKWEQGHSKDGKLIGLGTDIGGMAICYRTDRFEEAGLPTDREKVGELWPTWEDFQKTGEEFKKEAKDDTAWVDSITQITGARNMQNAEYTYFDKSDKLAIESNPVIKESFDYSAGLAKDDLSAGLEPYTEDWNAGIKEGAWATMICPAWQLGHIEDTGGPDGKGKWDVAAVPGGGGNWGGSFLGVPAASEHPEEAAELAKFLSSPDGQIGAWEKRNNLPSSPQALESKEVQEYKRPYFNDAPTGEIFGKNAAGLKPVYLGTKNQPVAQAVTDAMLSVDSGNATPGEAWKKAVSDAERAAR